MAKARPAPPKKKPIGGLPKDWLIGGRNVGEKYTAWQTKNGQKPTFGTGDKSGPGTPYQQVTKKIPVRVNNVTMPGSGWTTSSPPKADSKGKSDAATRKLTNANKPVTGYSKPMGSDARSRAIKRRLGG